MDQATVSLWRDRATVSLWRDQATVSLWRDQATVSLWRDQATVSLWRDQATVSLWRDQATVSLWRELRQNMVHKGPFYTAIMESILTSSITVWFAGATVRDKQRLQRIVRSAEEVIGRSLPSLQDLPEPEPSKNVQNVQD
uniref:Uncharacterized protein n=1 Tax=Knipowitschia caucasica TaxID=637954 RepID=A0AAV2JT96_KNICA